MTMIPMTAEELMSEVTRSVQRYIDSQPSSSSDNGPIYVKRILSAKGKQQRVVVYKMLNHNRDVGRNFFTRKEMAKAAGCSLSQVNNIRHEWEDDIAL